MSQSRDPSFLMFTMHTPASPKMSSFPLSSSRGVRQLPVPAPLCTTLPPIASPGSYHVRQASLSSDTFYGTPHSLGSGDSYFPPAHSNPCSIPSSTASTPAPADVQRTATPPTRMATRSSTVKRASISSLLSTPDNSSGNDSSASSPTCWSGGSSPTNTGTLTSASSLASTPASAAAMVAGPYFSQPDYDFGRRSSLYGEQEDDTKLYAISSAARKKSRSSSRASSTMLDSGNRDEYDVLGRKKPKTPRTPMSWDPKDDILLKQLKEEQRLGWKEIATHFRGRTSHACQFRWRRLASGQLKYYQGHRRPPPVTTTAASFANEMASAAPATTTTASPRVLMTGLTPSPQTAHALPHYVVGVESPLRPLPVHPTFYQPTPQPTPWGHANIHAMQTFHQPTPLPSPGARAPRFLGEDNPWSEQEDRLLVDRKLSFDEVNVLLVGRSEQDIWDRMVKLRQPEMTQQRVSCQTEARIPGIESVRYGATR